MWVFNQVVVQLCVASSQVALPPRARSTKRFPIQQGSIASLSHHVFASALVVGFGRVVLVLLTP